MVMRNWTAMKADGHCYKRLSFSNGTRDPRTAWSAHCSVRVGAIFFGFYWSWCCAVRVFKVFSVVMGCGTKPGPRTNPALVRGSLNETLIWSCMLFIKFLILTPVEICGPFYFSVKTDQILLPRPIIIEDRPLLTTRRGNRCSARVTSAWNNFH